MGVIARRWRVSRTLREFDFPLPFNMDRLLAAESASRGKPVQVIRAALGENMPTAMIIRHTLADYLVVPHGSSAVHLRHLIFHELYHRRSGHLGSEIDTLGNEAVTAQTEEKEAELFARLAERKLARLSRRQAPRRHVGTLERLRAAFNPSAGVVLQCLA